MSHNERICNIDIEFFKREKHSCLTFSIYRVCNISSGWFVTQIDTCRTRRQVLGLAKTQEHFAKHDNLNTQFVSYILISCFS